MRRIPVVFALAFLILIIPSSARSQLCGDIDGDGAANIRDLIFVLEHIGKSNAPPVDTTLMEFDGRRGITVGDGQALVRFIFNMAPINCGAAGIYTFPQSMSDTLFMPAMISIPDGINNVTLPLSFSLDPATGAVYLPMKPDDIPPGNDHFDVSPEGIKVTPGLSGTLPVVMSDSSSMNNHLADTVTFQMYITNSSASFGEHDTVMTIDYMRTEPGVGFVGPMWIDRSDLLRIAVERNGELYQPVIVERIFEPPPDSLFISTDSLVFTFTAGKTVRDTFVVDITSNGRPLEFMIQPSDPWIVNPSLPTVIPQTPFAMEVTVDSSLLPIGIHHGFIDITPLDTAVIAPQTRVEIKAKVNVPALFQTGDVDCNGLVDIADLTLLISHLFITFDPLPVCQE